MVDVIMARDALSEIVGLGRCLREAASFISEQCYELRLHAWAFVNSHELQAIPHDLWPILMWVALPDASGIIHVDDENTSIRGNWMDGRVSYRVSGEDRGSRNYNIQGIRFDRAEFEAIKDSAKTWFSEVIGAVSLEQSNRTSMLRSLPQRLPENFPFTSLSEALSWIAFGHSMDSDALFAALQGDRHGKLDAQRALAEAVAALCKLAEGGSIPMRGKYLESYLAKEDTTLTDEIPPVKLTDFRRFDVIFDGLRHGSGLMWEGPGDNLERAIPTGRRDYFVQVSIDRSALMAAFPPAEQQAPSGSAKAAPYSAGEIDGWCREWLSGGHGNLKPYSGEDRAWDAFKILPRAQGLSRDDVFRPAFRSAKTTK